MRRIPASYKAVYEMAARRRAERNEDLAPRGLKFVDRRDLRPGDVVVSLADYETVAYTVTAVHQARAKHYLVVDGVNALGPTRTSGHCLDDMLIRKR